MRIGLTGYHGSGKTTLAKAISEEKKFGLVESVAHSVFQRYGFGQNSPMSVGQRLYLQNQILERQIDEYQRPRELMFNDRYIADRTPLDMAAYMTKARDESHVPTDNQIVYDYAARCASTAGAYFDLIVIVPMVLPYEEIEKRPHQSHSDAEAYYRLIDRFEKEMRYRQSMAKCQSPCVVERMPENVWSVAERVEWVANVAKI